MKLKDGKEDLYPVEQTEEKPLQTKEDGSESSDYPCVWPTVCLDKEEAVKALHKQWSRWLYIE